MKDIFGIQINVGDKVKDVDGNILKVVDITEDGVKVVEEGTTDTWIVPDGDDLEVCADSAFVKRIAKGLVSYQDFRDNEEIVTATWHACDRAAKSIDYSLVIPYNDPESVMLLNNKTQEDVILNLVGDRLVEDYLDVITDAYNSGADWEQALEDYFKNLIEGVFAYKHRKK